MKKILLYTFVLLLLLPVFQKEMSIFKEIKLNGSFVPAENTDFSFKDWFSAQFQTDKEKYIKENIGFRPAFIMSYNQLLYSLFGKANNPGGVVGEEGYLYLESYIFNETGENYKGDEAIVEVADRLKYLQCFFEDRNIQLITVFLPSKASFFPEYIPDRYSYFPKSNYSAYCEVFDSLQIRYIDLNAYFLNIKEAAKYPLFPKSGLHWTSYGMALGMDTLIKKMEAIKQIDLPDLSWEEPVLMGAENHDPDYDAENLMNLFIDLPRDPMPYPQFIFNNERGKTKAKTLVISDSYYWQAYKAHIPHQIFDWGGFWYYCNTARRQENKKETVTPVDELDMAQQLLEQDVIVLFASQATLHVYPYNFDIKAYDLFKPFDTLAVVNHYQKVILKDEKWQASIERKAKENGISFEDQLEKDARWMAIKSKKVVNQKQEEIDKIIRRIKADSKWLSAIQKKAEKKNIELDEMIKRDALWIYQQQNKGKD